MPDRARRPHVASLTPSALTALLSGLLLFGLSFAITPTTVDAASTATATCGANLRTGASTGSAIRVTVAARARVTVAATVTGGSWRASCGGRSVSGTRWYRISAINGRSVLSLYRRSYLYGAAGLFTAAVPTPTPTASPTPTPTTTPAPAPTPDPTAPPTPTGTAMAAACDGVNLRAAASTASAITATVPTGTTITAAATVSGGSWSASCGGKTVSGNTWYEISAVNGASVLSLYGVPSVYAATGLFAAAGVPGAGSTPLGATVTFYGRGAGHGVGMSQYGARGRAIAGQTAADILAHYYAGTTLGTIADPDIRVLVLDGAPATATSPITIYGRGGTWTVDGIAAVFPADARLQLIPSPSTGGTAWQLTVDASGAVLYSGPTGGDLRVRATSDATLLELSSKPSAYDRYRGVLHVIATSTVSVVNELPLESYLRGVVPAEMPSSWPTEALKAQAIAARSYAAYQLRPSNATFDVYDDTRSQVYLGALDEDPTTDAALAATAGQVLRSGSSIADALFHSTGGGATENNENAFVSASGVKVAGPVSYLRGSPDRAPDGTPYDATSPYATWSTATYTLAQVSAMFAADSRTNVGSLVALDLRNRGVSGRLISITLIGSTGIMKTVSGDVFRAVFNAQRPAGDPILRSNLLDLAPIP